tara:strand:+ start:18 stop:449 length:432 start_codon:yes stop_codon:yes gene_type:complete
MDTHTQHDSSNPINYKESAEDRAAAKNELMRDTLQALSLEHLDDDALDYLNCSDELGDYDSHQIWEELNDNGYFHKEIIYYSRAMEYLKENDCSLSESVEIATEYGYTLENISSETLASLHASRKKEDDFYTYVAPELDKINN